MATNKIIAVVVVIILAAAGIAVGVSLFNTDDNDDVPFESRALVFGNADGDDKLDTNDIDIINKIIDEDIKDWKESYPLADANQDGVIDKKDVEVVNKYLNKQKTRLYYVNAFDKVTWINSPMSFKIGTETASVEFLPALGLTEHLYATDDKYTTHMYPDKYPFAQDKVIIGTLREFTVEQVYASGVETLFLYPAHGDYFWDKAAASTLADDVSIVLLDTQGTRAPGSILMLGIFFGIEERAQKYVDWHDEIVGKLSIIGDTVEKKVVDVHIGWKPGFTTGNFSVFKDEFGPVLHFHNIVGFQEIHKGKGSTEMNFENYITSATDEILVVIHRFSATPIDEFESFTQSTIEQAFPNTDQLRDGKIYAIEWDCAPNLGGVAGMYLLASYLYPDHFDIEDGYEYLQYFLDNFHGVDGLDAKNGFVYKPTAPIAG